jgi:hypothetical protein
MTTDNFCFYLQNSLIQTSQTGGQCDSDTSTFSIPGGRYQALPSNIRLGIKDSALRSVREDKGKMF